MAKRTSEPPQWNCPVYAMVEKLFCRGKGASEFARHLRTAHEEFLLAIRCLIDQRIEQLRQKKAPGPSPRPSRIKVTEKK